MKRRFACLTCLQLVVIIAFCITAAPAQAIEKTYYYEPGWLFPLVTGYSDVAIEGYGTYDVTFTSDYKELEAIGTPGPSNGLSIYPEDFAETAMSNLFVYLNNDPSLRTGIFGVFTSDGVEMADGFTFAFMAPVLYGAWAVTIGPVIYTAYSGFPYYIESVQWILAEDIPFFNENHNTAWAIWTPTSVPEPGILILLGISMASIVGLKRWLKD